jgi:uncharacterized protein DUF6184
MKSPFDARNAVAAGVLAAGALLAGHGCGGVTDERVEARDQATTATCTAYMGCGKIGSAPTDTYTDYDSCLTVWRGTWESAWDSTDCEGRIDQDHLRVCISAIMGVDCSNILDILDTLYVKCGKAAVCDVGVRADAGVD